MRHGLAILILLSLSSSVDAQTLSVKALDKAAATKDPTRSRRAPRRDRQLNKAPFFGAFFKDGKKGVDVRFVLPFTPAARMGLESGDSISMAWGTAVRDADTLKRLLSERRRGDLVSLSVEREDGWLDELKGRLGRRMFKLLHKKTGTFHLSVVLIDFKDKKHNPKFKRSHWQTALFSRKTYTKKSPSGEPVFGSMADYYDENSAGRFRLTGKVYDWVSLPKTKAEYNKLKPDPIMGQRQFLGKAMDLVRAREGKDVFAQTDGVAFVFAGPRGAHANILWPHSSVMFDRGRVFDYYTMEATDRYGRFAPIGVHCHEFGHVLGLPDFYGVAGSRAGHGCFCVMAVGHRGGAYRSVPLDAPEKSRRDTIKDELKKRLDKLREQLGGKKACLLNDGKRRAGLNHRPMHFSAHCKEWLGWVDPIVLDTQKPQRVLIPAIEGRATGVVAKVLLDKRGREYFLLEVRKRHKFDKGLPRGGLLIWHVGDVLAPLKNFVPFKMIDLEAAHGKTALDNAYRAPHLIPFPAGNKTKFTPKTKPSSLGSLPGARKIWITDIKETRKGVELTVRRG